MHHARNLFGIVLIQELVLVYSTFELNINNAIMAGHIEYLLVIYFGTFAYECELMLWNSYYKI